MGCETGRVSGPGRANGRAQGVCRVHDVDRMSGVRSVGFTGLSLACEPCAYVGTRYVGRMDMRGHE